MSGARALLEYDRVTADFEDHNAIHAARSA